MELVVYPFVYTLAASSILSVTIITNDTRLP